MTRNEHRVNDAAQIGGTTIKTLGPIGVCIINSQGLIVEANLTLANLLGESQQSLVTKSLSRFIAKDSTKDHHSLYHQIINSCDAQECELKMLRTGTDGFWARLEKVATQDAHGDSLSYITISDISARKSTEEKSQESQELFFSLSENSAVGIYLIQDYRFIYANPFMADLLEYSINEILDHLSPLDPVVAEDRSTVKNNIESKVSGEVPSHHYEFRLATKNNKIKNVEVLSSRTSYRGRPAIIGTLLDVTERKQFEETRQKDRSLIESIMETSPVGITTVDCAGTITYANSAAVRMLGLIKSESANKTYNTPRCQVTNISGSPFPNEDLPFNLVMRKHQPVYDVQYALTWPNGKKVILSANAAPILDKTGQIYAVTSTFEDITQRKQDEEALRENKERLSLALEISKAGIWEWNLKTNEVHFDDRFHNLLGYAPGELPDLLDDWLPLHHPEDVADMLSKSNAYIRGESPIYENEHRIRTKAGSWAWIFTRGQLVKVPGSDSTEYFFGIAMNTTERKNTEEMLRLNAERVQVLLNLNQMTDATLQQVSDFALEEAVRLSQSKIGYLAFLNEDESILTIHSWSREAMKECAIVDKPIRYEMNKTGLWGEAVRQRKAVITNDYEAPNSLKKGYPAGHVPIKRHMNVPVFVGQHIVVVAGVGNKESEYNENDAQQLTLLMEGMWRLIERKQAEEALKQSQERFRLSMEATNDGLWDWNVETDQGYFSPAYYRMLGYEEKDFPAQGLQWKKLIHPDDLEQTLKEHQACIDGRCDHFEVEYRMKSKSGDWLWILGRGKCTERDGHGRAKRLVGTHIDLTERKHTEEEKAKLENQLQQALKMESIGRLAGGVAHDFNNMLGVILGHVELALENIVKTGPLYTDLEEIRKAANRSADLTRQLLAFARQQTVLPKVLDLNQTISGMLKMLERLIGEDIKLRWQPTENLWPIKVDPSQIDQILANLCVNSRDAISGIGDISIEVSNISFDHEYCAEHPGYSAGDYVRLVVTDNGRGMDKKTLEHIFEPFFTTKGTGKGTGLGLATVYGIIKQNNGIINAYSELGQGTAFSIYLPRHKGPFEITTTQNKFEVSRPVQKNILLVEDEPSLLTLTALMLEKLGYTVIKAPTPNEAIALAKEHKENIDILITDVIMPEMNGRELSQKIKALIPKLTTLFMSGYTADVIVHHGVLSEGAYFIQKPFSINSLADKLTEALNYRHNN